MQNRRNNHLRYLSTPIRIILVLMLVLPTFTAGTAQARTLEAPTTQISAFSPVETGIEGVPLLNENFDYGGTAGDLTAITSNWLAHSGGGTNPVQYATTGLTMPSYVASSIGGSAAFDLSGEDVNRSFAEQTSGTVYFAALVNLSAATTGGDYFMHFKNASTGYPGRLVARDASGSLQFGIATGGTGSVTVWGATNYTYNTTYLAVVKYEVGTLNSALYILDSCVSTEPSTPLAAANTGLTTTSIVGIAIRQGGATTAANGTVDGIRVATNWADAATCYVEPPLLEENFDYGDTAGNLTTVSGGLWVAHSGTSSPVQYDPNGLSMPNYFSSGIGGSATYNGSSEDVNRSFASQMSGSVYLAALVNIPSAFAEGDYFLHLKNTGTGFAGRLFARDSAGSLQFGIATGGTGGVTVWGTTNYAYNTTYLAVVKYEVNTLNSTLYILESCVGTEPATPLAVANTGIAIAPISAIAIRQGAYTPDGAVDGIRVATNWASAVTCGEAPPVLDMTINKTAPATVSINEVFTYTLTVENNLGTIANTVVITDDIPTYATVGNISDGGVLLNGNVVRWDVDSMADGSTLERTVTVTAPGNEDMLVNSAYEVSAANWAGSTGDPVTTMVRDFDLVYPISVVRAAGAGWRGTIEGKATVLPGSFATRSFAIQDPSGGMYIYPAAGVVLPPMALGDTIRVKGTVKNYNGLLEFDPVESVTWIDSGTPPAPWVINTSQIGLTQGMLVQVQGMIYSITGTTNKTVKINDGSGEGTLYIYGMTGIDTSWFEVGRQIRVTGFSGHYGTTPQVQPRYQSDIIDLYPPMVTATSPLSGEIDVSPYRPLTATFSKPIDPDTLDNTTFTLTGPGGAVSGVVSYDATTKTATFTPDAALATYSDYTATLTTGISDIYGIHLDINYTWAFTTGAEDTTAPVILDRDPVPDEIDVLLGANVVISFSEDLHPGSFTLDHFILQGPYGAVPSSLTYDPATFIVTLNPEAHLLPTTGYSVTVTGDTTDWAGNPLGTDVVWNFTTQAEPPMLTYFGDIHNHTSYSDGSGTPTEALAAGEAAGFDFMAISDHSYAINDTEWLDTLAAVETATDSDFVALRGFEYTQGAEGHINVYNTERHAVRTDTGCAYCDYTPNLEAGVTVQGFYEWAAITGTVGLDTAGTVMQFNHPGWINFNDWTYHPEVSAIARMEEVGNGNGTSYAFSEDEYIRSLDYGWKVGASNNADTHNTYWGVNTDHRTGVLMTELSKEALLEALRERRTYATEDKNFSLKMKANGSWMGSEIANSGSIWFEIEGVDPNGEPAVLVEIITDQGKVAAQIEPNSHNFAWTPFIDISTGVHYFYVRVTQEDGDRIVGSPVWTMGSEDIAITDVIIQPSIPTIFNPSLLTARVTNRNSEPRTVTITMDVNGVSLDPQVTLTVPGNLDAYANFSWQPLTTGEVTITAHLLGAPAEDNPDDNEGVLNLVVTDEHLPLILIDAGHGNLNAAGREMRMFIDDLSAHQYNVLKNLDALTAADLDPSVVKLLIITAPQYAYTTDELTAISDYMAAGGSLWMLGLSDYTGKVPWAATVANRENAILNAIETRVGSQINMRVNDDEIIDADDNNGYVFGVTWSDFPSEDTTSIGINVDALATWSLNSLRGRLTNTPLTASTPGIEIITQGDLDTGYTVYSGYNDPNHTSNVDADNAGDAYIYNPSWVYPWDSVPADAIPVPMAAVTDLPGEAGRIMLYGDSSDPFTTFAYTAGDGKQNELFNLEAIMWLLGEQLQKSTIAEARAQGSINQPDNLDRLVWVEGYVTAAYGEFFNVLYVQDETGGITVHAPAGDIDPTSYTRGTKVRVVGTVGIYNGDTEIEFFEAEMVQVIEPSAGEILPLPLSTSQAALEENQGWLTVITGTITSKVGIDNILVDDGSGVVRAFLDGYNGDFNDLQVNDLVRVTGLVSEDGDGQRIRVRNHFLHPGYPDDVVKLDQTLDLDISKSVLTPEQVLPGSVVTYTLELSNVGTGAVLQTALTDTLPDGLTFGGFISSGGASELDGTISWSGTMPVGMEVEVVFTATVYVDYNLYGQTITNSVSYTSPYGGSGNASAAFTIIQGPEVAIEKNVVTPAMFNPGSEVVYTLSLANTGEAAALDVSMTDALPDGITFAGWVQQNGAVVTDNVVTWMGDLSGEQQVVFTATVGYDSTEYGKLFSNTVEFTSENAGSGSATADFSIGTPELTIDKSVETANDPAMPGDPITYTLVVDNPGTTGAVDVHIWDTLPEYVIGDDLDLTVNINAHTAQVITIVGRLALDVPLGITIVNTGYYENGALSGEDSASFNVWAGEAELSIEKTVEVPGEPVMPGDPITYTVSVRNDGTADAVGVHIWDTLPEYVVGDDVDVITTIEVGEVHTIIIHATLALDVPLGLTITNTAYFEYDIQSGTSSASFSVWAGEPELSIEKLVEVQGEPIMPGDPITYTVVVRNDGTAIAEDVHIWDTLPEYVVGEDVDVIATIEVGEAHTIIIPATVALDVPLGTSITNTAYYEYDGQSGDASVSFTVWAGEPVLSIEKTVDVLGDPVLPYDPITYTITVRNDGTADAVDVHIWDILPDYVGGEDVDVTATISIGEVYTITIPASLAGNAPRGSTIVNTAYYEWDTQSGEASASIVVAALYKMHLPFIWR